MHWAAACIGASTAVCGVATAMRCLRARQPQLLLLFCFIFLCCNVSKATIEETYAGRLDVLARPTNEDPLYLLRLPINSNSGIVGNQSTAALELLPGLADVGELVRTGALRAGDTITLRGQLHIVGGTEQQLPALRVNFLASGDWEADGGRAISANVQAAARTRSAASTSPEEEFVILFIPVAFCDAAPAISSEELQGILFGAADGGGLLEGTSGSVAGYLGFCSNGRRTLSPGNAIIAEGVAIPCNGTNSYGARWSTSRCTTMDLYGWAESALDLAVGQLGPQVLNRIQHVVVITPDGSWWKPRYDPTNCAAYLASGEVGRGRQLPGATGGSFGFVWVTGERRSVLNTYLHELSHNLGLYHAGTTESCQYCDRSCALGGCCLTRCHNAAHLWALGWAEPVEGGSLVLEGLTEGLTLPYQLPAQHSSDASFVMIDASPGNPNGTRVFLSYRRLRPPYESFDSQLDNSVLVHRYLSGGSRLGNMDTQLVARLAPPSPVAAGRAAGSGGSGNGGGVAAAVWRDDATRLWVQVLGSDGAAAAVTVCRAPLLSTAVDAGSTAATAGDGSSSSGSGSSSGTGSSNGAASPPSSSPAVDWSACQRAQPDPASVLQTMSMAQRLPAALQLSVVAAPPPAPPLAPPPTPPPRPRPQAQAAVAAPDAFSALLRRDDVSPPLSPAPVPLSPSPSLSPSRAPGSSQAAEASRRGTGRRRGDVAGASSPPAPQPPPLPASPSPPAPVAARDTGAAAAPALGPAGGGSSGRRKRPPPPAHVESRVGMGARRTAAAGAPPAAAVSTRPSDGRGVRRLAGQVPRGPRT